jgi:hypothetical protein
VQAVNRGESAQEGVDAKASGTGVDRVEGPKHLDARGRQADLLVGFPQRRIERGQVVGFELSARERELAVMDSACTTDDQDDAQLALAISVDREQDSRLRSNRFAPSLAKGHAPTIP